MSSKRLRILFVDDDERVLNGLRRMVRSQKDNWDTWFANGGHDALALLRHTPCDLVVSDMRMPRMTGSQFLSRVRETHPETIRFMLTGYSEVDHLLANIGPIHQFLRKPCRADEFRAAITLAATFRERLKNPRARAAVSALESLPAPAATVRELLRRLDDASSSMESIAALIQQDGAIAAKVLQLVNTAFFASAKRVLKVGDAVSRLGLKIVRHLVVTSQLCSSLKPADPRIAALAEQSWMRASATAIRARRHALDWGFSSTSVDAVYLAGLMSEIGRVILIWSMGDEYLRISDEAEAAGMPVGLLEERELGTRQGVIGGYLLALWGFDREVVEAVTFFERPSESGAATRQALAALHCASCGRYGPEIIEPDESFLARIGIVTSEAVLETPHMPDFQP